MESDLNCIKVALTALVLILFWMIGTRGVPALWKFLKRRAIPLLFGALTLSVLSFLALATTPEDVGRIFFGFIVPFAILFVALRSVWQRFF